jgi:F-box-like
MNPHTRNRITPTNDVISHSEARDIRNQLSEAEMDLTYLNERITATCAMLDKLMGQHRELTAEITEYRISLASHKKLPPEILGTIFQYCITDKILILPQGLGDLLHLCHICSYWRRVALGTPTLWNRISVEIGSRGEHSFDILDVATTLLSRSGVSTPLSITLAVYTDSYCLDPEDPVRILINPYIHRYQGITLIMPPISFLPLLQLPVGSAEVLEVLDLEFDSDSDDSLYHHSWSDIFAFFNSAPRLRSVTLRSFDVFNDPELLPLAYSQLTSLHFVDTPLNPDICHAMLRQCPNLINCTMCVETDDGVEESLADLDPIVVLNLRQFKLELLFQTSFALFLRSLVLPALKDFGLTSHRNLQYDGFKSLLSRSSFDLERVALPGMVVDGSDLESLLQHMPFLVELDI